MKRAYITGRGLVTPLGIGQAANIAALKNGVSGICAVQEFIEHNLESQVGGKVQVLPDSSKYDRKQLRFCQPNALFALEAVSEALAEANIHQEDIPQLRIALIGGVAGSYFSLIHSMTQSYCESGRLRDVSPLSVPRVMPSSTVANLSLHFGFNGESYDISAACSSGAIAVMQGARLIESGMYDIVVAGGAENLDWVQCLGFTAARALSRAYNECPEKASRPFDVNRDGFVMSDGAGILILEELEHARKRGANILAEVVGYGASGDAYHMTAPREDGAGAAAAIRSALRHAGLSVADVDYVNAHGTSTQLNERCETAALKAVFGAELDHMSVSSTKGTTGHALGAAGGLETIVCAKAIGAGIIPPTINFETPDPACDLDVTPNTARERKVEVALNMNLGFGGHNGAILLRRYKD